MASAVDEFLESIINYADEGDITPDLRQAMRTTLAQQLDTALLAGAITALPDEQMDAYEQLIASKPRAEQLQHFFNQHIPNLTDIYRLVMIEFRRQYVPDSVG